MHTGPALAPGRRAVRPDGDAGQPRCADPVGARLDERPVLGADGHVDDPRPIDGYLAEHREDEVAAGRLQSTLYSVVLPSKCSVSFSASARV
jgi:hypothetical protein